MDPVVQVVGHIDPAFGQDRFVTRGRARRAHEFARVANGLDIQQNGAGIGIVAQIVEAVAEIHVGRVAQRNEVAEPDSM